MIQDNTTLDPADDRSADWLDQVAWNEQGLVPAITQAYDTHRVLTLAW